MNKYFSLSSLVGSAAEVTAGFVAGIATSQLNFEAPVVRKLASEIGGPIALYLLSKGSLGHYCGENGDLKMRNDGFTFGIGVGLGHLVGTYFIR